MDFRGDDQLYYEVLDSITGPGRIIVAAAGNTGARWNHFHKPAERDSAGCFIISADKYMLLSMKSRDAYTARVKLYSPQDNPLEVSFPLDSILGLPDSMAVVDVTCGADTYKFTVLAYPSCFNSEDLICDVFVESNVQIGMNYGMSVEAVGRGADIDVFRQSGYFYENGIDPGLADGDNMYGINSPGSAPEVIAVGSVNGRLSITNYQGILKSSDGELGVWTETSSVGPTFDGRIKPDVLAPGTYVVSSYSSYYMENHPDGNDLTYDVARYEFNGRTYSWNSNSGTSMSSPVVAGAIALWLEADPTLSPSAIREILSKTAVHTVPSLSYPNNTYGYGVIDVHAGLLEVLCRKSTGLRQAVGESPLSAFRFTLRDGMLSLSDDSPVADAFSVDVYNLQGVKVAGASFERGQTAYDVDLQGVASGVYVARVKGSKASDGAFVFSKR